MPGIINSITLKPSFEAGWDINRTVDGLPIKDEKDADGNNLNIGQIPRMIEVDMTFTPIHDFTPQLTSTFINNTPVKITSTPSPSSTPDTTNTPATPDTSTFGIVDPTLSQLQNSTDSSGNPVDWGANTPR